MASNLHPQGVIKSSNFKRQIRARFLLNHLKAFSKDEKTLDLGAGWGISLLVNPDFYCCDVDEECLAYLRTQTNRVERAPASGPLPYEDNFFDNVFTHDFLEHLDEDELHNIFMQVGRVLKPGGVFLNVVPHRRGYQFGLRIDAGHKTYVTRQTIQDIGGQHGFEVLSSWTSPLPAFLQELYVHNKVCVRSRLIG